MASLGYPFFCGFNHEEHHAFLWGSARSHMLLPELLAGIHISPLSF